MKKNFLFAGVIIAMLSGFASTGFGAAWTQWMNFNGCGGQGNETNPVQYDYYSINYDVNLKSAYIEVDYYGGNASSDTGGSQSRTYRLYENTNPKLFSYVNNILMLCLNSVNQIAEPAANNDADNDSGYMYFSFFTETTNSTGGDGVSYRAILGIKTGSLRQKS
ncbi:MAG: hypothetical protein ABSG94_08420 [Brevinematales bacterium]|jgi:hypothetical protein